MLVLHPDAFCRNSSALKISTYTLGPFCVSVPATPMDIADSVRDADNIRLNKIPCWGWCQAPQPNTRGELAPARTIYVILGDAWEQPNHLHKTVNGTRPRALAKSVLQLPS